MTTKAKGTSVPNDSRSGAMRTSGILGRLTKAELIRIIEGEHPRHPLTYEEFCRCAIAAVARWCHGVQNNHFTCTEGVKSTLDALCHIYKKL